MATPRTGSVTAWIGQLLAGNGDALAPLLERYFEPLADLAARRIPPGGPRGGDDLANSAFVKLWQGAASGRIAALAGRDDLWRLLLSILNQKVRDHFRYATRERRVPTDKRVEADLDGYLGNAPDPLLVAAVDDEFQRLLDVLDDDELRDIARCKLLGYENAEIAARLDRALTTIAYKLKLIRAVWQQEIRR